MSRIDFQNSTDLDDVPLLAHIQSGVAGWAVGTLTIRFRYSRGADFSGSCYYIDRRIFVNLGRHLTYPYILNTSIARAKTIGRHWYKPMYGVELKNADELVVFVFMHELYHLLVKRARRNTRQKESMCDRFATRYLVDRMGTVVLGPNGDTVSRDVWDFQDLDGFVAAARDRRIKRACDPTTPLLHEGVPA